MRRQIWIPCDAGTHRDGRDAGMLMPTSITLFVLALTPNLSIAELLIAGLIPRTLTGVMLCVYCYFYSGRKGIAFVDGRWFHSASGAPILT